MIFDVFVDMNVYGGRQIHDLKFTLYLLPYLLELEKIKICIDTCKEITNLNMDTTKIEQITVFNFENVEFENRLLVELEKK
jgi:hypothetical protein